MSSAAIKLICPNLRCRTLLSVPPTARGKNVRCRQCGTRIQVPAQGKPKPSAPAATDNPGA
ncbi:MAG: hypothetical protein ACE37H_18365 [Phycisphaeraceae bacterium]